MRIRLEPRSRHAVGEVLESNPAAAKSAVPNLLSLAHTMSNSSGVVSSWSESHATNGIGTPVPAAMAYNCDDVTNGPDASEEAPKAATPEFGWSGREKRGGKAESKTDSRVKGYGIRSVNPQTPPGPNR